ncbi:hypothetical protein SMB96_004006 [Cronobacter sakazakii]|nr:hypothetical protein [Cronobacter sakazakii]
MMYDNLPLAELAARTEVARNEFREKPTWVSGLIFLHLYLAIGRRAMSPHMLSVRCETALRLMTELAIDAA